MNQGLLFIGLGGSTGARISLKSNWAGAAEICRFIFIGGCGGEGLRPFPMIASLPAVGDVTVGKVLYVEPLKAMKT